MNSHDAVVEHEQLFSRSLIEAMPGIFYLYDQSGKFLRWNRNFETVSGYTGAEIARMHPLDFGFVGDDRVEIRRGLRAGEQVILAP